MGYAHTGSVESEVNPSLSSPKGKQFGDLLRGLPMYPYETHIQSPGLWGLASHVHKSWLVF